MFLISLLVLISSTLVLFCSFFLLYISVFRFSCILMCIWLLAARCGEIKFICIAFRPTYTKLQMYRTFPPGHISPDNFPPHLIPQRKFGNKLISRWDRRTLPAQPRRRRKLYHPYHKMTLILFWNIKWLFVRFTFCHRTTVTLDTQWQNAHTFLERIKLWQKINLTNNHLIFQHKIGVILCENNWRLIWHIIQHTALASSYWTTKNKGYGFYWPTLYTPCSKKNQDPWCLIITLANVDRFSKFFHQEIRKKIIYVHIAKISTSPAICTLWKSKIQKMLQNFHAERDN